MTSRPGWTPLLLLGPPLAAGAFSMAVSLGARDADPAFLAAQERVPVTSASLARAVALAPAGGRRGRSARCRPGSGPAPLRNPWACSVVYPSRGTVRYVVTVGDDGAFRGRRGPAVIAGRVPAPG
ncbi:MAG: hypothetical protein QOH43_3084 [Solirubrobacteraceae bacterium]|jgi:hypothetical protein|nr:hypothetical protein [Solirubrobacteraceae bacterium]